MNALEITDIPTPGYERVVRAIDKDSGLHAIVSIHDTTLGPALGGLRMLPYKDETEALFDVNRLSKGMTYKSAIARTGLGGGKSVILGDPAKVKSEALYLAMGRFLNELGGRYITAEDMNTSVKDLETIRRASKYVSGLERKDGGSGNPSPYTAYGVFLGLRAAVAWVTGSEDLKGRRVVIQGVGAVGGALATRLKEAGAQLFITDANPERQAQVAAELGATVVSDREAMTMECDAFAPCARGAILTDETVPNLACKVVAGAANNVLLEPRHGRMLMERGILYAPDYVINAGGIINVSVEFAPGGYNEDVSRKKIERIPQALKELWTISREQKIPTSEAADQLAATIVAEAKGARLR